MDNYKQTEPQTAISGECISVWHLVDDQDKPMHNLYNLDAMLECTRMAVEYLQDNPGEKSDLCHISHLLSLANMELSKACEGLEVILREIKVNPLQPKNPLEQNKKPALSRQA